MTNNFLVTYSDGEHLGYNWFETEEEALDWIEHNKRYYEINDAIEILGSREILNSLEKGE